MSLPHLLATTDFSESGRAMHRFAQELYPICRSITGEGIRETLRRIARRVPLTVHEVPSGTRVFDWTVPLEWNIRDAYVKDRRGRRVIDFQRSNLHVVNYSAPVRARLTLEELKKRLHSLPDRPDWIPYRTSYYREDWGFCVAHRQLSQLPDEEYEVCIDSRLEYGSLTYGECLLEGRRQEEVLISCHACHPSLCNDNLSGLTLVTQLGQLLASVPHEYSYRLVFIPATIGSITWLARNEHQLSRIRHGLVVACVGDPGRFTYKRSRRGDAEIDRAAAHVLRHSGQEFELREFSPYGYDERQYCSPGFDLPVGSLTRTPYGAFPQYHTSADGLDFIEPEALAQSLRVYLSVFQVLEHNRRYLNRNPKCEPQLGQRGLYRAMGGDEVPRRELAMLWVLNLSDGRHSLLEAAERSGLPFPLVQETAGLLLDHGLLEPMPDGGLDQGNGQEVPPHPLEVLQGSGKEVP